MTPKSKKKMKVWTEKECQKDKWVNNTPLMIRYHQWQGISIHNLPKGCNYANHTDYIRQLMRHESLSVNIKRLDDRITELKGLSSSHNVKLLAALKEWRGRPMGHSGILPQYIVKAFAEPAMQRKITGRHDDHWHSHLMVGMYCIHQYGAISKVNVKESGDSTKPTARGYCPCVQLCHRESRQYKQSYQSPLPPPTGVQLQQVCFHRSGLFQDAQAQC